MAIEEDWRVETIAEALAAPSLAAELARPESAVVRLLSLEPNLALVVRLMYGKTIAPKGNSLVARGVAFHAYEAIAEANPTIISALVDSEEVFRELVTPASVGERLPAALGYFQDVIRTLLSELNPLAERFIEALGKALPHWLIPMAARLAPGDVDALKHILVCQRGVGPATARKVFEYLLYVYLNEKIVGEPAQCHALANIVEYLIEQGTVLPFKLRYVEALYDFHRVRRAGAAAEALYHLRVALLAYLAKTGLAASSPHALTLLDSWKRFRSSPRLTFYLLLILSHFLAVVKAGESLPDELAERLLALADEFPTRDVLHNRLFALLMALPVTQLHRPSFIAALEQFCQTELRSPNEATLKLNRVAAPLILSLLSAVEGASAMLDAIAARLRNEHKAFPRPVDESMAFSELLSNASEELPRSDELNHSNPTEDGNGCANSAKEANYSSFTEIIAIVDSDNDLDRARPDSPTQTVNTEALLQSLEEIKPVDFAL